MFVYVIGWDATGPVKIGITKDLDTRMGGLQCALPFPCQVLFSVDCGEDARRVESAAHRAASKRRLYGEWFNLSPAAAISSLRELSGQEGRVDEWFYLLSEQGDYFKAIRDKVKSASAKWAAQKRTRDKLRQRRHRAALKVSALPAAQDLTGI